MAKGTAIFVDGVKVSDTIKDFVVSELEALNTVDSRFLLSVWSNCPKLVNIPNESRNKVERALAITTFNMNHDRGTIGWFIIDKKAADLEPNHFKVQFR